MKVLLVTNMYPTKEIPFFGIFVKEQKDAVESLHQDVNYDMYFIEGGGVLGGGFLKSVKNYIKSIFLINRKIRKGNYDLVHIHYGLAGLFVLNPLRRKIPTILTLHGGDILEEQNGSWEVNITKKIIKRVSHTIALNERMYEIVRKYTPNVSIIPCAVDTELFVPTNKEKNKKPLIVFPSAKSRPVKNYPLFEETINLIRNQFNISCDISEVDKMSRTEVCTLFQKANLLLMTSISEGSPQAVKEAMACNLPVVSTPVGDVKILLDGVKDSAVSDNHDSTELASLCAEILINGKEGITGREKLLKLCLDKKSVTDRVYDLYKKYLD